MYVMCIISAVRGLDGAFMRDCNPTCVNLTVIVAENMFSKLVSKSNIFLIYIYEMWTFLVKF